MGPSPEHGDVVDAGGRVHGVDRLFVVDASIIPDAPSGFPHLITIMLAEHLAEAIGRQTWRLSCQSVTARSPKAAPCGSFRIDIRPPGKSIGGVSSRAPDSSAVRCDASTSFTVKYTSQ